MVEDEDAFVELQKIAEQRDYVMIEYPGYADNIELTLQTLGGLSTIEQVSSSH
jgi:hypothetical protein